MRAVELLSVCIFSFLILINVASLSLSGWLIPLAVLIGCLPLLSLGLLLDGFLHALVLFTCCGVLFANQCHKWAHMKVPPKFARILQRFHLILRTEEHRLHHRSPYNTHFCTASGWLNRPFNRLLK